MGRRVWTDTSIWTGIRKLDKRLQELYLRLFINDSGNIAGYYKLNIPHLATDMGVSEDELLKLLKTDTGGKWFYDEKTEQVLIPEFTTYNMVKGDKQEKKLNSELNALKPCPLHKEFLKVWKANKGIGAEEIIDEKFRRECEILKGLDKS